MADLVFPENFLWGAATSAHQTEGDNRNSDWWQAEVQGRVPHRSGRACESWERWPEDLRLLGDIGLNAYRLSVEWARIEPEPGRFDQAALDHYRRVVEAVRAAGIEPIVTLHHFTNPAWLAPGEGWANPEVVPRFAAYADQVARRLGDLVTWWVTINEPEVFGLFGHVTGDWPPHRSGGLRRFLRHGRHCRQGHIAARQALKAHRASALASMAFHLNPIDPVHPYEPTDRIAVMLYDWLWQGRNLRAAGPHLDWVGLNYYFRIMVRWELFPWRLFEHPAMGPHDKTEYGWEVYPKGLYRMLKRVALLRKPVIVTENGIADHDEDQRPRYLVRHLMQAHRALREGVDLRGYVHWSLMDNFEWAEGFTKRFGLAHVDFATQQRTLRPSARLYGSIARANRLEASLQSAADPLAFLSQPTGAA